MSVSFSLNLIVCDTSGKVTSLLSQVPRREERLWSEGEKVILKNVSGHTSPDLGEEGFNFKVEPLSWFTYVVNGLKYQIEIAEE